MTTTVVPSEITSLEDRLAGNLTLAQLGLIIAPLLLGLAIFLVLPREAHFNIFKTILISFQALVFGSLALRLNGRLIGQWLRLIMSFALRPRFYLYDKNDTFLRANTGFHYANEPPPKAIPAKPNMAGGLGYFTKELRRPRARLVFKRGAKGGLDVVIS